MSSQSLPFGVIVMIVKHEHNWIDWDALVVDLLSLTVDPYLPSRNHPLLLVGDEFRSRRQRLQLDLTQMGFCVRTAKNSSEVFKVLTFEDPKVLVVSKKIATILDATGFQLPLQVHSIGGIPTSKLRRFTRSLLRSYAAAS
jgi:hypothetical protein